MQLIQVLAITPITTTIVPDDPGYTGSLEYDPLSSQTQVGFVVGLRKDKSGQNFCGGSLIAPSYVLTAAHCVVGGEAKYVSVGSRASAGTETELIPVKPEKVIVHPLYGKRSGISYDVAILELANQAYPAPIQLDNALAFDASTQFTLFGYGANSAESRTLSPVMRSVELPYFDRTSCAKFFPELDDSMLCAGGQPARDACTGDSGSPLVYYQDGKPVLVGVVSTGRNGCGTPGVPGIYGYVSTMQGFVNSYTAGCNWVDPNKRAPSLDSALSLSSTGTPTSGSTQPESATSARTYLDESNENQIPFEIVHSSTGVDEHQLLVVKLAVDTPPLLQDAVKAFLLGGYSMIGGTWERMSNEIRAAETTITFYSSGEMLDLMKTIAKYSFKPLNQRTNRFGTRFDETTSSANCCDRA
uniref:Peptidase S1 domain-containing protein n=1 Tax=Globisporangium ultimum (strain ATCC 200006 / CBS 805.95 / DAOM BR144) TaxID=431595 RepID=K3WIC6_GLOUD